MNLKINIMYRKRKLLNWANYGFTVKPIPRAYNKRNPKFFGVLMNLEPIIKKE